MAITTRPIRKNDAKDVCKLFRKLASHVKKLSGQAEYKFTEAAFRRDGFSRSKKFDGWVAVYDKKIIGYLIGHFGYEVEMASRIFYIIDLYTDEKYRRMGVAFALMKTSAKFAVDNGAKGMLWTADKNNHPAQKFYTQLDVQKLSLDVMVLKNKKLVKFVKS